MTQNLLAAEFSPYLLQHKDNPVHWFPWGDEAFKEARQNDKPLLLSIGYAACHWCHVMAHESFENDDIASLMNELFVNVKVDREERPDVDAIYMNAVTLMGQQGGWPLTAFLTPKGEPYWGGTYFPPESKFGRPGFQDVLRTMSDVYHSQKDKMDKNIEAIQGELENISNVPEQGGGLTDPKQLDETASDAVRMIDPVRGGTMGAPKFPMPTFLGFFWRAYKRTGNEKFKDAVELTLRQMCQGGIYDHLGGGFARYSTDEAWLVPHFEKMLYDNAQLVELMTLVWQETRDPFLDVRIAETIAWCLRDLRQEGGGFASSLDADSEGGEGKFYVWDEAEIDALLGDQAAAFKQIYDVNRSGNWEGHTILNRTAKLELGTAADETALKASRDILLSAREKRIWPELDDKILADWNGMMISALVLAAKTFVNDQWLAAARDAYAFVRTDMMTDNRLVHSWRRGQTKGNDVLDDYAQMIRAALYLYQFTGEGHYLDHSLEWTAIANDFFWDTEAGAYFLSPSDAPGLITRTRSAFDNATPSGNGVLAENLATLYLLTGDEDHRNRAERLIGVFTRHPPSQYANMTGVLNGFERLAKSVQVLLIGDPADETIVAMQGAALSAGQPDLVVQMITPEAALPAAHPAAGKTQVDGRATAYVCIGPVCGRPVIAPEDLKKAVSEA